MNRILTGLVSLLTLCQLGAYAQVPRLVVMISVEELRSDLLEELATQMPADGINRLLKEGKVYTDVRSPLLSADATASEAILHTGTLALGNGIPERQPVKRERDGRRVFVSSIFEDKSYTGFATTGNYSPIALTAPTIGDNLKLSTGDVALVYSIAPMPEEAIIAAGQRGDGAYWIDSFTARWASTTYYSNTFPWYIDRSNNDAQALQNRLSTGISWQPLYELSKYLNIVPLGGSRSSFNHRFTKTSSDITSLKTSGLANEEVVKVAKNILDNSGVGQDETPDLLSLHFSVGNGYQGNSDVTLEVIDSYYRLDRQIAELLRYIDQKVKLSNTLIVLSGNGMSKEHAPHKIKDHRIFKVDRCKALCNMYLNAEYGVQGIVDEISNNGDLFLNKAAIKANPKLTLEQIQSAVADFLLEFSGVQFAIENYRLRDEALANNTNKSWQTALNSSLNSSRADVVFGLLPGWVSEDLSQPNGVQAYRMVATPTLFIMMHPSLQSEEISAPLDLRNVSNEVSKVLRIRPPTPAI